MVLTWQRREIENYLCYPETLAAYAEASVQENTAGPLFSGAESSRRLSAMQDSITEVKQALQVLAKGSPWDVNTKVSDDFLVPLFETYFKKLKLLNVMAKKNFHELAILVPQNKIVAEVKDKLDAIVRTKREARPRGEGQGD